MAGLCEGGNEPAGSLKTICVERIPVGSIRTETLQQGALEFNKLTSIHCSPQQQEAICASGHEPVDTGLAFCDRNHGSRRFSQNQNYINSTHRVLSKSSLKK
ncbi:hypothetical protein ANN_18038 [Periplaneta americana]|uniref:Uncharacterized protein n=1 Tax=Periplaneta americana TaxID=6978 RepID=A0ABQ8SN73_PERAM|nr:hypothetical protein ANN_18038 [Periplaneta americana]